MSGKRDSCFLSLGAGVQSTAMALLADSGRFDPMPTHAIFADTQSEPDHVYETLDRLKKDINNFEIVVATAGDLKEKPGKIPFFLRHENGKIGMGWRQCTNDYKIQVVEKTMREILGLKSGQRYKGPVVDVMLGISTDEIGRMKESRSKWTRNVYPLIEQMNWNRSDCQKFLSARGVEVKRSACVFCPYKSDREWLELKANDKKGWEEACAFDKRIREPGGSHKSNHVSDQYVHRSCVPLDQVEFKHEKQVEFKFGFGNECDGMCGV